MDWEQIKKLFHETVDLSHDERESVLNRVGNGDAELRQEVTELLRAHDRAGNFIMDPALIDAGITRVSEFELPAVTLIGKNVGPYQIIRELGRGGMGAVFLAARADSLFEKQVAIKIIKRGMDSESILRRFVMERQILANLEHPNIARFLDGGTTEDGLPYFVMEYVAGEPITKYCDAKRLNTSDRLRLFQAVCGAVQHAHQHLTVHRDLKPSNILVTPEGTPKLLDFGIAKLLHPDQTTGVTQETASAFRLMTPEYASPEQLRGLPVSTATDVYSLGVVLYELLSGHRPFQFRNRLPDEIVRVLLTQEPERPSLAATRRRDEHETVETNGRTANHNPKILRGDLDNIILKALRKDRERRYASIQEFATDIQRYLDGLPVTARPDTFSYRAGKFIQRHRAGVATAALITLTLISATIVTAWQARVASRERAKAERRFTEQRAFASTLINEVQTSLRKLPDGAPAQRILAQISLDYLNNLARDAGEDPVLMGELARAYINVGYLQAWTLQDNPGALVCYQQAIEIARKRTALEPNSYPALHDLDDALASRTESLMLTGQYEDAAKTFAEKLAVDRSILARDPKNPEQLMVLAETTEYYGEMLRNLKRVDDAMVNYQTALDLASEAIELSKSQAHEPEQRVNLSLWYEKEGDIYEKLSRLPEAIESYRAASLIAEAVHKEHPENVQATRNTSSSHWYLGGALDRLGDHNGALANFRISLQTVSDSELPIGDRTYGEAKYSIVMGKAMCKVGDTSAGLDLVRHGIEVIKKYIPGDRGTTEKFYYAAELLAWAADALNFGGRRTEAITACRDAISMVEGTMESSPKDSNPRLRLVSLYELLGNIEGGFDADTKAPRTKNRSELADARRWYQKALDLSRETVEQFKLSTPTNQSEIETLQQRLAQCDARLGR